MAGGIAGAVTTPLDLMKTLLQTQQSKKKGGSGGTSSSSSSPASGSTTAATTASTTNPNTTTQVAPKHYSGILEGMVWNYRNHGLGGLFRGVGPRVFWTSLQSAVMFVIYEQVLHVEEALRKRGEWPPSEVASKLVSNNNHI